MDLFWIIGPVLGTATVISVAYEVRKIRRGGEGFVLHRKVAGFIDRAMPFSASDALREDMAEAMRRRIYPLEPSTENASKAMEDGRCFHCGETDIWLAGPEGGGCQNLRCMNCGQMVNYCHVITDPIGVEPTMRAAYEASGRVRGNRGELPFTTAPAPAPTPAPPPEPVLPSPPRGRQLEL